MSHQHKELAQGRWGRLSFLEQMANIGSEIERALHWKAKHDDVHCQRAFERSLELFDLTLDGLTGFARLKELARMREAVVGYFLGTDQPMCTEASLRKYFSHFIFAARRNR